MTTVKQVLVFRQFAGILVIVKTDRTPMEAVIPIRILPRPEPPILRFAAAIELEMQSEFHRRYEVASTAVGRPHGINRHVQLVPHAGADGNVLGAAGTVGAFVKIDIHLGLFYECFGECFASVSAM